MHVTVRVQEANFDVAVEYHALRERCGGDVGAVANFVGLVRDRHADDEVMSLYLEHYPGMTERSMEQIVGRAAQRWPLIDVVVVHRVGALEPREQIVFVQVAAAHRDAAFQAAQFVMDFLKTDAVIWKREDRGAAQRWLEASSNDRSQRLQWDEKQ